MFLYSMALQVFHEGRVGNIPSVFMQCIQCSSDSKTSHIYGISTVHSQCSYFEQKETSRYLQSSLNILIKMVLQNPRDSSSIDDP